MEDGRRRFLCSGPIALAALTLAARQGATQAQAKAPAGGGPHLAESDAMAKALGYVQDAAKADKARFANWKAGETCAGCLQFKGAGSAAWGPCQLFPGKQVRAKGWCSAWQKKA
jgi:hypothetical protein